MPAPFAVTVISRRRVTVSPSKAPGIPRSAVYLDLELCGRGEVKELGLAGRRESLSGKGKYEAE
jgi:hypothetical protein